MLANRQCDGAGISVCQLLNRNRSKAHARIHRFGVETIQRHCEFYIFSFYLNLLWTILINSILFFSFRLVFWCRQDSTSTWPSICCFSFFFSLNSINAHHIYTPLCLALSSFPHKHRFFIWNSPICCSSCNIAITVSRSSHLPSSPPHLLSLSISLKYLYVMATMYAACTHDFFTETTVKCFKQNSLAR